jgi:FtsZ-interacting cell division protein YlmF
MAFLPASDGATGFDFTNEPYQPLALLLSLKETTSLFGTTPGEGTIERAGPKGEEEEDEEEEEEEEDEEAPQWQQPKQQEQEKEQELVQQQQQQQQQQQICIWLCTCCISRSICS